MDGRLKNLIWASEEQRQLYSNFSDVAGLDTTKGKCRYDGSSVGLFVIVDNEGNLLLFCLEGVSAPILVGSV